MLSYNVYILPWRLLRVVCPSFHNHFEKGFYKCTDSTFKCFNEKLIVEYNKKRTKKGEKQKIVFKMDSVEILMRANLSLTSRLIRDK